MKKLRSSPVFTAALFLLAAGLILASSIGGARAALNAYSARFRARIQTQNIGVTLLENGETVSWQNRGASSQGQHTGTLLEHMLPQGQSVQPGAAYDEVIAIQNSGSMDEYVRVSLYKYWLDAEGNKLRTLTPAQIDLNLTNLDSDWLLDQAASTAERTVLYYRRPLAPGETTAALSDTLTISGDITRNMEQQVEQRGDYTILTNTYSYDGARFQLEITVDAVQTHNGPAAISSAWGRRVSVGDEGLSLEGGQE